MPVQKGLFDDRFPVPALPVNYEPVRPDYFHISRIYLAKAALKLRSAGFSWKGYADFTPRQKLQNV